MEWLAGEWVAFSVVYSIVLGLISLISEYGGTMLLMGAAFAVLIIFTQPPNKE